LSKTTTDKNKKVSDEKEKKELPAEQPSEEDHYVYASIIAEIGY